MANETDIKSTYLRELIKKDIPKLSTEEEHRLAGLIAQGDDGALERLVTHNLRFVPHVVTKMTAWGHGKMPLEDILSIGNEMLFIAARRWKPVANVRFSAYARPFIERGVRRELDNTANIIRLPVNVMEEIKRMNYQERALSQVLGRKPTVQELSVVLGVSASKIHQLRSHINKEPISLDNMENDKHVEENEE
jgi:RNA polymerase primary sigma factor